MIANGDYQLGCGNEEDSAASNFANIPTKEACRALASSVDLLHHCPSDSMRSHTKSKPQDSSQEDLQFQLGFSFEEGTESGDCQRAKATAERQLGVRTETSMDLLEGESSAISQEFVLKPSELVRLLNSCGFGQVISERQLFRHREKAPRIEVGPKRIDLLAYCAWMHSQRHRKIRGNRRRVGNLEVITLGELRRVLESQNYRCALTNQELTPNNFALDHIIPLSDGGDFSESNCQAVAAEVNRAKHTMSQDAFIDMCVRVAQHIGQVRNQNIS
jgi:hypothetical protein